MSEEQAQSVGAEVMKDIANRTIRQVIFIANPAPFINEDMVEEDEAHRGNTPWYISIPALGISVQALDKTGEPKTGYFHWAEAKEQARQLWNRCLEDPELLERLQAQSEWPENMDSDGKIMFRYIDVEPFEVA